MRRGAVFVYALIVTTVIVMALASGAAIHQAQMQARINRVDEMRANLAAEAAIQRALAVLAIQPNYLLQTTDQWQNFGTAGSEAIMLGRDHFRVQIVDESSKLNINSLDELHLRQLPLQDEQVAAILDWREPDLQARPLGAKDEYYNELPVPYNTALQPYSSVDELLLVKGITPQTLYFPIEEALGDVPLVTGDQPLPPLADLLTATSASPNLNGLGEPLLDVNTAEEDEIEDAGLGEDAADEITDVRREEGTFQTMGDVLRIPALNEEDLGNVLDILTVGSDDERDGLLNVNTALEPALRSIPEMPPEAVDRLLARQGTIAQLSEMIEILGIEDRDILASIAGRFTLGSSRVRVRAIGRSGAASVAIEALVALEQTGPRVIHVKRVPFEDAAARWGWEPEAASQTILWEGFES